LPVTHCGDKIDAAAMHDDDVTASRRGPDRVCRNCQALVPQGVQFCPHCGETMGERRSNPWPAVVAAIVALIIGGGIGFALGNSDNGSSSTVTKTTTTTKGQKNSNTNVTVTTPTETATQTVTAPPETVTQTVTVTTATTTTAG
jgi:ribosomal protein L40E